MRKIAKWFGYRYVRLDGEVYLGIDQYRAWYSGRAADVADNEAVRFAKEVLGDKSYRQPLSADMPRRDALYEKISEAARSYRQYRTLREALAATMLVAEPTLDPMYSALLPRLHFLHQRYDEDLKGLRKLIEETDRDELLHLVDQQVKSIDGGVERALSERSAQLNTMHALVRSTAISVLEEKLAEDR